MIAITKTLALARAAPATTAEPVTVARALTRASNMPGRVTTAAPAITTAVDLTRTTATTQAGRLRTGVTARPGGFPRTRTMGVIRTMVTPTTTRTTRQRTAITHQWLQLCSGALANSVTTTAWSTELLDRRPGAPSRLLKAEMA